MRAKVAYHDQAGAYPGFCSMKRLGVFLLPPIWDPRDASPKCYLQQNHLAVSIYTPGWTEAR